MNVVDLVLAGGAEEAPAVFYGDQVVTHGELRRKVDGMAAWLVAHGSVRRERIGIWSETSPFFVAAYLGVMRAGSVAVPFQADLSTSDLCETVESAEIRTVLVSRRYAARARKWLEGRDVDLLVETELDLDGPPSSVPFADVDESRDLAALLFTSGSTGQPKGVMVSHRNILCNTRDILSYMDLGSSDRAMVVLPFHYCFGLSLLHTLLAAGGSVVLNNAFMYPERLLQELESRECTGFAGVPSTFQILLRKTRFKEMALPRLDWLQQAGGKLPNPFIRELVETFPHVRLFVMYGQTEATARLSYLPPERLRDKLGSVGQGLPSTRLEVLRPDGRPVAPGSDEIGEIVASGDNVTVGYWRDPEETARFFREGRLFTGDLARVDEDGFIYIVERERDFIKCGGNRVSCKEIEEVIAELASVTEVAVVGVPDEILGEAIVAFVTGVDGSEADPGRVVHHCRLRLPLSKQPSAVRLCRALPHNSQGKVMKTKLREMAGDLRFGI